MLGVNGHSLMQWDHRELAQKVIDARLDEEVHLMLCAAVFDFQSWRKAHTHLEQPAGSEMLYQPELQHLYANMLCSRCDQCVAGLLTHPETDKPNQKGDADSHDLKSPWTIV